MTGNASNIKSGKEGVKKVIERLLLDILSTHILVGAMDSRRAETRAAHRLKASEMIDFFFIFEDAAPQNPLPHL